MRFGLTITVSASFSFALSTSLCTDSVGRVRVSLRTYAASLTTNTTSAAVLHYLFLCLSGHFCSPKDTERGGWRGRRDSWRPYNAVGLLVSTTCCESVCALGSSAGCVYISSDGLPLLPHSLSLFVVAVASLRLSTLSLVVVVVIVVPLRCTPAPPRDILAPPLFCRFLRRFCCAPGFRRSRRCAERSPTPIHTLGWMHVRAY